MEAQEIKIKSPEIITTLQTMVAHPDLISDIHFQGRGVLFKFNSKHIFSLIEKEKGGYELHLFDVADAPYEDLMYIQVFPDSENKIFIFDSKYSDKSLFAELKETLELKVGNLGEKLSSIVNLK